jgi:hypothetical protein
MNCPNCGLINPDSTLHCVCGYDFVKGVVEAPSKPAVGRRTGAARPAWVWVITVYYVLGGCYGLLSLYLIHIHRLRLGPATGEYIARLTAFDYALAAVLALSNITAALFLFFLHRRAASLFLLALVLNVLSSYRAFLGMGFRAVVIGWLIQAAVCGYSFRLKRRGVLR